jgi:glycine dehydrogenase
VTASPTVSQLLAELGDDRDFISRHIGPSDDDRQAMLQTVGATSVEALLDEVVPASIRMSAPLSLGGSQSSEQVLARLRQIAAGNDVTVTSLIGMGYYGTLTPPVVLRNVLENPAWYTAYTPYQPEISQGRLEALLNFQTMVANLTGMSLASASLLDEATAAAEAMTMARRISKSSSDRFVVHPDTHPQTIAVLATRAEPLGIDLIVADPAQIDACFGALLSLPTSSGAMPDWAATIAHVHDLDALAVVATDLLACVLASPPGALGADIAVGSSQRFGVPMGGGGPHAGFIACSAEYARSLPGRLVGVSTDAHGRPALRLALQTREQHIRREKATSNICTAQVLLANIAGMYAVWHGPHGLRRIAERVHLLTSVLGNALVTGGRALDHQSWFDTLSITGIDADEVLATARRHGLLLRRISDTRVGISLDETTTLDTVRSVAGVFGVDIDIDIDRPATVARLARRTDEILPQAVFHRHRSEHEMLRYLRRLADADLALDRTMIPLGSCTMKLNATVEMIPITWPEFANVHPFAPADLQAGYATLVDELEQMLVAITGYDNVSLQPNAGSQGEFAGLLAIRGYHRSRGEQQRTVCLIPSSAHGTNAASAVMAGMSVVVVNCDAEGNVDLDDVRAKAAAAGSTLAAIMVTYPSTHGVFESGIVELCDIVHAHGGQVYVDGANLNALVGVAQPGKFGADVSHINLHKTFCIPHGGGGPGVGPVAVKAHLAPFLSQHISAAPKGSAGILPISWTYIALMGADGLRSATGHAILAANYVARRLHPHFPLLYTGEGGRVAHECILDLRQITRDTGVTVDDVAKRLIDYGFHAPTMSFPVAGTLMVEPTESEALSEIDRFCDAMIAIRGEIDQVARGEWPADDNPLRNAPHTAADLVDNWNRPYPAALAAYPLTSVRSAKYFPPVSRIDGAYGDRNLVCTCEPLEVLASS